MNNKCKNCNNDISGDIKFCPVCGAPVVVEEQTQVIEEEQPQASEETFSVGQEQEVRSTSEPTVDDSDSEEYTSFLKNANITYKKTGKEATIINIALAVVLAIFVGRIYTKYQNAQTGPTPSQQYAAQLEAEAQEREAKEKAKKPDDFKNASLKIGEPFTIGNFTYTIDSVNLENIPAKRETLFDLPSDKYEPKPFYVITMTVENNGNDANYIPFYTGFISKEGYFSTDGMRPYTLDKDAKENMLLTDKGILKNSKRTEKIYCSANYDEFCVLNKQSGIVIGTPAQDIIYGTLKLSK